MKMVSFICTLILLISVTACSPTSSGTEGRLEPTMTTFPQLAEDQILPTSPFESKKPGVGIAITPDNKVAVLKDDGTWEEYKLENAATSLETWQSLDLPPDIMEFFKQLFETVGVHILDTGEQFTCIFMEDHVEFKDTLNENNVDYVVEIYSYQVDRLARYISRGELDDIEKFRILKVLVKSEVKGANHPYKNPLMSSSIFRWLIRGKNVLHVNLISPDLEIERDGHYTFLHAGEWVVVEGLRGTPKRVLNVTLDDALELQIKFYESMKADSWINWVKTAIWYKEWRKNVSQPISEG